jgi:hypothetical protein
MLYDLHVQLSYELAKPTRLEVRQQRLPVTWNGPVIDARLRPFYSDPDG